MTRIVAVAANGEPKSRGQFHHHFRSSFCADILLPKKLQSQNVIKEKLEKHLYTVKVVLRMLV